MSITFQQLILSAIYKLLIFTDLQYFQYYEKTFIVVSYQHLDLYYSLYVINVYLTHKTIKSTNLTSCHPLVSEVCYSGEKHGLRLRRDGFQFKSAFQLLCTWEKKITVILSLQLDDTCSNSPQGHTAHRLKRIQYVCMHV